VPIFTNLIISKGAHLNFAMGATLHRYATARGPNVACHVFLCGPRSFNFSLSLFAFLEQLWFIPVYKVEWWSLSCYNFAIL